LSQPSDPAGARFHGPNLAYVLEMYEGYRDDPASVDEVTRGFFERWSPPRRGAEDEGFPAAALDKALKATRLVEGIRSFGYAAARLDPLGSAAPLDPVLEADFHGVSEEDLEGLPAGLVVNGPLGESVPSVRRAVDELRRIYCGASGYDFAHVRDPKERLWLRDAVESGRYGGRLGAEEAVKLLKRLTEVDTLERFLQKTFLGQTRFGLEGLDMSVPMLDRLVRRASEDGIPEVVMGTVSRGRLNLLAHLLGEPYAAIFGLFERPGGSDEDGGWVGDVKHHQGARGYYVGETDEDRKVLLDLPPNPSHLEYLDPVAEGMARAAQEKRDGPGFPERDGKAALAVLTHGDAAFAGEGVAAETLNLCRLPGYTTGGTIHIVANNQIGYTTEPWEGRSTAYASDPARGYDVPVVHVNADDPEACLAATEMAYAYRREFSKDFVIDLIGYRRRGHNEGDEPAYTQPKMYEVVREHPTVREIWGRKLEERGVIEEGETEAMAEKAWDVLDRIHKEMEGSEVSITSAGQPDPPAGGMPHTGVASDRLEALNESLLRRPEGFSPNPKLERLLRKSRGDLEAIDWAHAEALAFATLLEDGVPVRLTGQDTVRGTFSQRHAALYDVQTGESYVPLHHVPGAKASFAVHNSPLSEIAAMGFEYGYALNAPEALVLWEAQYGDFANVAQPIIDQFVVSGRYKWGQRAGLVLLLPHGHEGKGPEHSSARLERFLQLAAAGNIRVANCTTAAQYFHLLRAQAGLGDDRRPLVLMTPKSLLRHPMVASPLKDLSEGWFRPVLDDEGARAGAGSVERLVLCSGKIFVEIVSSEAREQDAGATAVVRIELLYPFPEDEIRALVEGYPNLREVVWVQEEPKNAGAWSFAEPRLRELLGEELPLRYVGKPGRPAPSQGSAGFHKREHEQLILSAFREDGLGEVEGAVRGTQGRAPGRSD
jgi:2-oxoglutarate dehydrogenase E1 component